MLTIMACVLVNKFIARCIWALVQNPQEWGEGEFVISKPTGCLYYFPIKKFVARCEWITKWDILGVVESHKKGGGLW